MALRIAINGMGVIGREMFKTLWGKKGIEIVFLNDNGIAPANLAYLLKYDSIYHDFEYRDTVTFGKDSITVDGKQLQLYNEYNISNLPLGEYSVDYVLDCTGTYNSKEKLSGFINAGAKHVIACYKCGNDMPTIVPNVNQETLKRDDTIIAVPEMETQVAAAVLKILASDLEIQGGMIKAFRSYTNAQPTMDSYTSKDIAYGRSAPVNITPLSDGFAKAIGLVVPELNGKVSGLAYRSPVINGSIMDFTIKTQNPTDFDSLRTTLKAGSNESIGYSEDALCSSDALSFESPQILAQRVLVMPDENGSLINISVAYDNVRGYCNQMARFLKWYNNKNW